MVSDPDLLTPGVAAAIDPGPVVDPEDTLPRIVVGSVTARALYRVWSGRPVTVVDSPPGAGKSTLIRDVVAHLVAPGIGVMHQTRCKEVGISRRRVNSACSTAELKNTVVFDIDTRHPKMAWNSD